MSKKSEYQARADACGLRAAAADGRGDQAQFLKTEAEWRRLARACYDTRFGASCYVYGRA